MRGIKWAIVGTVLLVASGCVLRGPMGRHRPDVAAFLSFDEGPLTFSRAYSSGDVGPFTIGDSRSVTRARLSTFPLLDQDKAQLSSTAPTWTVALRARNGGYTIYTLSFEGDRIASVRAFYSLFAGL